MKVILTLFQIFVIGFYSGVSGKPVIKEMGLRLLDNNKEYFTNVKNFTITKNSVGDFVFIFKSELNKDIDECTNVYDVHRDKTETLKEMNLDFDLSCCDYLEDFQILVPETKILKCNDQTLMKSKFDFNLNLNKVINTNMLLPGNWTIHFTTKSGDIDVIKEMFRMEVELI